MANPEFKADMMHLNRSFRSSRQSSTPEIVRVWPKSSFRKRPVSHRQISANWKTATLTHRSEHSNASLPVWVWESKLNFNPQTRCNMKDGTRNSWFLVPFFGLKQAQSHCRCYTTFSLILFVIKNRLGQSDYDGMIVGSSIFSHQWWEFYVVALIFVFDVSFLSFQFRPLFISMTKFNV